MSETKQAMEVELPPVNVPTTNGLIKKLCEVMAEASYLQKKGRNEKFNYSYVTEADVVEILRDKLAKRNVFIFPLPRLAARSNCLKPSLDRR